MRQILFLILATVLVAACEPKTSPFARHEARMLDIGFMRTDRDAPDALVSRSDLARNFERIALRREFSTINGKLTAKERPAKLSRWEGEITYRLTGDGVRPTDNALAREVFDLMARNSGLTFRPVDSEADMTIYILAEAGQQKWKAELQAANDYRDNSIVKRWIETPNFPCFARTRRDTNTDITYTGIIGIRANMDGLTRRSCFEEEISQSLGLGNDHKDVRPSIFNDDEEFALMTEHDQALMRILYDPRLKPGMSKDEAMPIVRRIVAEMEL